MNTLRSSLAVTAACLVLVGGCGSDSGGGGVVPPPVDNVLTDAEIAAAQAALDGSDVDIAQCVLLTTPSSATVLTDADIAAAQMELDDGMC